MLSSGSQMKTSIFYQLAKIILSKDSHLHIKIGMDRQTLAAKLDEGVLTFEECCRFVKEARDERLLRHMMEQLGMVPTRRSFH